MSVRQVRAAFNEGRTGFAAGGEMARWLILALVLPSASSFAQDPKAPAGSFLVEVTCRTVGLDAEVDKAFKERIKQISAYAKEMGRKSVPGDKEGWEVWMFEVSGDSKFDPSIFQRAFLNIPNRKFGLTFTGAATQDPQTKVIFLTSAKGTAKVKLMNGRRDPFKPEQEVEDIVARVSAEIAKGKKEFTVKGEIFNHGGTLALLLEECSAGTAIVEPEKPKALHPPYRVTVMAKSRFARGKDGFRELLSKIEKLKPRITLVSQTPMPNDNAGWESWEFEISSELKLDVSMFPRLFGDIKTGKFELGISGSATQDPKTKVITVTAYGGNIKVKLMNKPKSVTDEGVDHVGKAQEAFAKGKTHFRVAGEIASHGGTLAIYLASFSEISPPK